MKTLDEIVDFHGHMCPGLALGYRVSEFALRQMGARAEDEELVAIVENDSCAVDAVQVMTGCTFGKGNLKFLDHGKQVYTFIRRPSGESLRVAIDWTPPGESPEESQAWEKYSSGDRSDKVLALVHKRKSRKVESILNASDEEMFKVSREKVGIPLAARIYPSRACDMCGEKTMEPRMRLLNGQTLCLPCFREAEGDKG